MTFPASPRVVFRTNPLEEVVCQLNFPTILEIGTEAAKFQNVIRDRYPLYEHEQSQFAIPKEIGEMIGQLPVQFPVDGGRHKFSTADGSKTISLATEFVALSDRDYESWEAFSEEVERARRALEEKYGPAFYTRIGLRYRNVIDREKLGLQGTPWQLLFKPSLLGLLGAEDEIGEKVSEVAARASIDLREIPGARITIRHGLGKRVANNKDVYLIDIDTYTGERSQSQHVDQILAHFHEVAGHFFRWAITDALSTALGRRQPARDV